MFCQHMEFKTLHTSVSVSLSNMISKCKSTWRLHTSAKACNNKLCPEGDPDQSQNLMGSKLNQDPSSHFFCHGVPSSSISVIMLTKGQTGKQTVRKIIPSLVKVIKL